jgi:hypothetical protein|tara:strand:- start:2005 stop:2610 length:606 start_codon:yes stop_codon:yes gene_type:complete
MLFSEHLKNMAYKLSGSCFAFGDAEIFKLSEIGACLILDSSCLPFWKYDKLIMINTSPFLPYAEYLPVKMTAFDGSKFGNQDVYGNTIDSLSLEIKVAYKKVNEQGYSLQNLHYLPDTKKTFSASLGGYPKTEGELNENWKFRKEVHLKHSNKPVFDILPYVSKPKVQHKAKFLIASVLITLANKIDQKSAKICKFKLKRN